MQGREESDVRGESGRGVNGGKTRVMRIVAQHLVASREDFLFDDTSVNKRLKIVGVVALHILLSDKQNLFGIERQNLVKKCLLAAHAKEARHCRAVRKDEIKRFHLPGLNCCSAAKNHCRYSCIVWRDRRPRRYLVPHRFRACNK